MKKEAEEGNTAAQLALSGIPMPGLYISNKTGARFVVEDIYIPDADEDDDSDTDGFFLVNLVEEDGAGDMGAIGYEFTPDEWREFAMLHGLFKG